MFSFFPRALRQMELCQLVGPSFPWLTRRQVSLPQVPTTSHWACSEKFRPAAKDLWWLWDPVELRWILVWSSLGVGGDFFWGEGSGDSARSLNVVCFLVVVVVFPAKSSGTQRTGVGSRIWRESPYNIFAMALRNPYRYLKMDGLGSRTFKRFRPTPCNGGSCVLRPKYSEGAGHWSIFGQFNLRSTPQLLYLGRVSRTTGTLRKCTVRVV